MKKKDSVCDECAISMGYEPDDKSVGMLVAKCDFCGKKKWLTSLSNDWHKKEVSNG